MADEPIADVVDRALAAANSAEMEPYTWLADAVTLAREVARLRSGVEALAVLGEATADRYDIVHTLDHDWAARLRTLLAPTTEQP